MQPRTYRKNYSPITYEKDDIPDLFAAVNREGLRRPTFLPSTSTETAEHVDAKKSAQYRTFARDVQKTMRAHQDNPRSIVHKQQLPRRPKRAQNSVSPWFALTSGMVVAGAFVMALVAVAPERMVPTGAIAQVIEKAFTATVIFSGDSH